MINIDFINVNNGKLLGRLLPFWSRGKRIVLFLLACLSPLVTLHDKFKAWALEHYIIAHITAQKQSIEWYLNYKLKGHFDDDSTTLTIMSDVGTPENIVFRKDKLYNIEAYTAPIFHADEENIANHEMKIYYKDEVIESTNIATVYAPIIFETVNYTVDDYKKEIQTLLNKFMTNFRKYNIIIVEQQ